MNKLENDILLGSIGGATIASSLTWIVTYGSLTNWSKGSCDNGWLELSGFVVGWLGIAFGFIAGYYFERRDVHKRDAETFAKTIDTASTTAKLLWSMWRKFTGTSAKT